MLNKLSLELYHRPGLCDEISAEPLQLVLAPLAGTAHAPGKLLVGECDVWTIRRQTIEPCYNGSVSAGATCASIFAASWDISPMWGFLNAAGND